jgi:hypothetical protein
VLPDGFLQRFDLCPVFRATESLGKTCLHYRAVGDEALYNVETEQVSRCATYGCAAALIVGQAAYPFRVE